MQKFVSLIIPFYNVERFIEECISSVLEQTLGDMEVVLVNDASPDNSHVAAKRFAEADSRVRYVEHPKNLGHGGALNTGYSMAEGKYIWCIDGDDYIDPLACEFLYRYAEEHALDALAVGAQDFKRTPRGDVFVREEKYTYPPGITGKTFTGREFFTRAYLDNSILPTPQWAYFFRRDAVSAFNFRRNVSYEDYDGTPALLYPLKRIRCINYKPYFRRIHEENSIAFIDNPNMKISPEKVLQRLAVGEAMLDYLDNNRVDKKAPMAFFAFRAIYLDILSDYRRYADAAGADDEPAAADAEAAKIASKRAAKIKERLKARFGTLNFHRYRRRHFYLLNQRDYWELRGLPGVKAKVRFLLRRIFAGTLVETIYRNRRMGRKRRKE